MKNTNVFCLEKSEIMFSMELMQESKDHLLTFIAASGYNSSHREYKRVVFLIKDNSDLAMWVQLFKLSGNNIELITETTNKFKEYKIEKLNVSLNEFIASCLRSLKNGIETLLQIECDEINLNKINEKLHSNENLLIAIYKKYKEDKSFNYPWIIANTNWNLVG